MINRIPLSPDDKSSNLHCPICDNTSFEISCRSPRRRRWWGLVSARRGLTIVTCPLCDWAGTSRDGEGDGSGRRLFSALER